MSDGTHQPLKAPFPYFGGKRRIASAIWERLGDVANYVEPFFGSGAVLLARPHEPRVETVNDADGFVSNFWRAIQSAPDEVAAWADWPVNENDLHARHAWLVGRKDSLQSRLEGDPDYFDAKVAGWWVWGMACWIGGEFCSGKGPWRPVLCDDGAARLLCVDPRPGKKRTAETSGVYRRRVSVGGPTALWQTLRADRFHALADRLARVKVFCGDWKRVVKTSVLFCGIKPSLSTIAGVVLDPPYSPALRRPDIYTVESATVAADVRKWAIEHGDNPRLRIAVCGYEGEHKFPRGWNCVAWSTSGGMGNLSDGRGRANAKRERIWFSPHCLKVKGRALARVV